MNPNELGLTSVGFALGIRRLYARSFVTTIDASDERGEEYNAVQLTEQGWEWIDKNEKLFILRKPDASRTDDSVPFNRFKSVASTSSPSSKPGRERIPRRFRTSGCGRFLSRVKCTDSALNMQIAEERLIPASEGNQAIGAGTPMLIPIMPALKVLLELAGRPTLIGEDARAVAISATLADLECFVNVARRAGPTTPGRKLLPARVASLVRRDRRRWGRRRTRRFSPRVRRVHRVPASHLLWRQCPSNWRRAADEPR